MSEKMKYESAVIRIEEIVRLLESGDAELDKSLSLFEEGIGLIKLCNEKLSAAEQRVKMLVEAEDGSVYDMPFVKENED